MIEFLQAVETAAVAGQATEVAEEVTRMGLWELFLKGGWLMWPLVILGGITVFIFVERFIAIRKATAIDNDFMNRIRDYISEGNISAAIALCRRTDSPVARMIEKGIERIGRPMSDIQTSIENVANVSATPTINRLVVVADDTNVFFAAAQQRKRQNEDKHHRHHNKGNTAFFRIGQHRGRPRYHRILRSGTLCRHMAGLAAIGTEFRPRGKLRPAMDAEFHLFRSLFHPLAPPFGDFSTLFPTIT